MDSETASGLQYFGNLLAEDIMPSLTLAVFFTENEGQPATGLTLADIDMYLTRQDRLTGADTVIWDGTQNPTEEIDNMGAYSSIYGSANFDDYHYYLRGLYTGATILDVDDVMGAGPGVSPWSYTTRTLSQAAASVIAAVEGSTVTMPWATSWDFSITGLGDVTARAKLYITIKRKPKDGDSLSVVQIEETEGLRFINAAAATVAGNGTLTVDDAVAGDVTVTLAVAETAKLKTTDNLLYDFKMITAGGLALPVGGIGRFNIGDIVTGAIA